MKISTKYNNPSLIPSFSEKLQPNLPTRDSSKRYGRIKRIILSEQDKDFNEVGRTNGILAVRYYPIGSQLDEDNVDELPIAFPLNSGIKVAPVLNEIIQLVQGPRSNEVFSTQIGTKTYYTNLVNVYGNRNHNALPDATDKVVDIDIGQEVEELSQTESLQPFPGDVIVEGRTGNSIRLSGYKHPDNPFTNDNNNSDPFLTLVCKKFKENTDLPGTYVESLNDENSCIFIGTNHNLFLNPTRALSKTYRTSPLIEDSYIPEKFNTFTGRQIGIKSGRVTLSGDLDGVFIIGEKTVGLSGNSVNIEGTSYVGVDANKIFLGEKSKIRGERVNQPAIRGQELVDWEKELLNELRSIARKFSTVSNPAQAVAVLSQVGNSLIGKLNSLESRLERIKSHKVYIE